MEFKLADIYTDASLLKTASQEADRLLREDPDFAAPEHQLLGRRLERYLEKSYDQLNL